MKCPLFGAMPGPFFTMLKPHLAQIYFDISQSSENFKTESILSKEHVYGVFPFCDHLGPSLDQDGAMCSLPLLLSIFLDNLSVSWFFSHTYSSFTVAELMISGQFISFRSYQSGSVWQGGVHPGTPSVQFSIVIKMG